MSQLISESPYLSPTTSTTLKQRGGGARVQPIRRAMYEQLPCIPLLHPRAVVVSSPLTYVNKGTQPLVIYERPFVDVVRRAYGGPRRILPIL